MAAGRRDLGGTAVKIGLSLGMLNPSLWVEATREADRLGFESVWMPEHLVIPVAMAGSPHEGDEHPPIPANVPVFDVFTYLGFLAGQTEKIHFGTQVYNIGLRHPFVVARAATTLDVVSGGRLEFGIGASWLEAEWEAVGLDFHTRGRRVDETIDVCRRLWRDEVVEHHGEFFDFGPVMFEPKPTSGPPLHIGGDGPAALRRAATVGDGWIPMNHALEEIPAAAQRIAQLRGEAGRDGMVEITLGGGSDLDDLRRRADMGVGRALVRPWTSSKNALESIRRFSEEVLPVIRDHPVTAPVA
jgi:probable F420-dependent oxidoreductase